MWVFAFTCISLDSPLSLLFCSLSADKVEKALNKDREIKLMKPEITTIIQAFYGNLLTASKQSAALHPYLSF